MYRNTRGFINSNTLTTLLVLVIIGVLSFFSLRKFETVLPHELAVVETWNGVDPVPKGPGTHQVWRFFVEYRPKSMGGQVFVMNNADDKEESVGEGRRFDQLSVKSKDNQEVLFSLRLTWRRDPNLLIHQHQQYPENIEETLIRPTLVNAFVKKATTIEAIDMYSGDKFNELQQTVQAVLQEPNGALAKAGVIVDLLVLEKPTIPNKEYVAAIEGRQLALIQESQAQAQKKANEALALAEKAKAEIALNKKVVEAEADKQKAVLEQRAISEKETIAAQARALNDVLRQRAESEAAVIKAEAEAKVVLAASEASKQAGLNEAVVIEARGRAEAEAKKLSLQAFNVEGADAFVKVEVAKSFGVAFSNVKGYLPSDAKFNVISESFTKGVNLMVGDTGKTVQ